MPFGGFDMPVQYSGIIDEHHAVRSATGLFDVSHMGEVYVSGPEAFTFVQHLVSNDISKLYDGKALYTVMCRPDGGIVDDLLVYRRSEDTYMLVINAANIEKDWQWMVTNNPMKADLHNASDEVALLALQGPKAIDLLQSVTKVPLQDIKYYHFVEPAPGAFLGCERALLSRTGYTGEPGFEIYCEPDKVEFVWHSLMEAGESVGLKPAGLGARDTLRLEAGFSLYGNDLTDETNPLEAGLGWVVKLESDDFIGRDVLTEIKTKGPERKLVAFVLNERGIPRQGCLIRSEEGDEIGIVTSGSQSPILGQGIGMGYVPNMEKYTQPDQPLRIDVRGRLLSATVKKPPLHK